MPNESKDPMSINRTTGPKRHLYHDCHSPYIEASARGRSHYRKFGAYEC